MRGVCRHGGRAGFAFCRAAAVDLSFLGYSNTVMETAADVARGVSRLLIQEGYSPILEFTLANGRRLDVAALGADGTMAGVEIKVALGDLKSDRKWPEYLEYCELFYFAIPPDFPEEYVPRETGLIVADRYGGAIIRPSPRTLLHASRRKAVTLGFARVAAERLSAVLAATDSF
jgi:hypothetical protein